MSPSIPGSAALLSAAGRGADQIERTLLLVPRLAGALTTVEALLQRVEDVVAAIETTRDQAHAIVERVAELTDRADALVEQASGITAQLAPLLERFQPTLLQLQPILDRITRTTDPDEVAAIVEMVNLTPELVTKLRTDIIPVIDTLGTVAPDVRDLLDVSKELNGMLAGLPGLGRIKRKVEEQRADHNAYRAAEEPPPGPERGPAR
jgi:ABC-type transporter Mla subunit MlaD